MKSFSLAEYLKNPSRKVATRDGRDGVHISKNILYDMCDNIEYIPDQNRQNIDNIPEEFHAANAHDIMDYLMHLK